MRVYRNQLAAQPSITPAGWHIDVLGLDVQPAAISRARPVYGAFEQQRPGTLASEGKRIVRVLTPLAADVPDPDISIFPPSLWFHSPILIATPPEYDGFIGVDFSRASLTGESRSCKSSTH
jgi:hypothetical protein